MKTKKKHFSAFSRLIHESVVLERTSKAKDSNILNSKGEWGKMHLPRLRIDESPSESKEELMKSNKFSNSEKDWNVSLSKNLIVKAKRKASSVFEPDDDNEPLSNVNKNSATFSFSHKDIESSTKAANNLKPNRTKKVRFLLTLYRPLPPHPFFT